MRVLRWAGRFWTGILIITVLLATLLLGLRLLLPFFAAAPTLLAAHVCGGALPSYAPAFLLARYQDQAYQKLLENWSDEGQL